MPLAVVVDVDTGSPALHYIHADHLNRPIAVTDASGVAVHEAWLPFGEASGSYVLGARFPGQWFQSENGLHYNWHRHYDPTTGRYTQGDPLGFINGPSVYAYALNSPQVYTDPTGLFVPFVVGAGYAVYEVGSALADAYNFADILTDPCSSGTDIGIAAAGLGLSIIAPGGGYGTLGRGLRSASEPNRIYSARALKRQADEPGPFHNFPESFNNRIFSQGERRAISDSYVQYDLKGSLNGRPGVYEIGVRPSASGRTEVITHRFFRPNP